jgi:lysophospholipase L1-like esterase
MEKLVRIAMAPVMKTWLRTQRANSVFVPRPTDTPQAHSAGFNSDRVLIFGSGPAVGWGVVSHDIALPGALARALTVRTSRGTDIDVVSDAGTVAKNALAKLQVVKLGRYDAALVILGVNDAMQLTPLSKWRTCLTSVLGYILEEAPVGRTFVTGIHPIRSMPNCNTWLGRMADAHAVEMNTITASICARLDRVTYIPLGVMADPVSLGGRNSSTYKFWAESLADTIAPQLDVVRQQSDSDRMGGVEIDVRAVEQERQQAIDELKLLETGPDARFDWIVERARELFGTETAAFSLVNGDKLWQKASSGRTPEVVALKGSFAEATMAGRGALVVQDALADERFRDNPHVAGGTGIRFWAGFPIECASGQRIGTLSVWDSKPRVSDPAWDRSVLRQLALMVQAEICRA